MKRAERDGDDQNLYTQQQLNRITGGAYLAKQQRLIQNAVKGSGMQQNQS